MSRPTSRYWTSLRDCPVPSLVQKITFSADESVIERAREVARSENKSLDEAFREWLYLYGSRNVTKEEIEALYRSLKYVDAGRKLTRDEMNER